jgi:L-histidine Nalpha-methyltransferase
MIKDNNFMEDILDGLNASPKKISSKYFYDETGDKLFHYIMNQPEYYLTCAEHEILQDKCDFIFSHIDTHKGIRIIEPGAGDGFKTRALVNYLVRLGMDIVYNPIDISSNVLDILCQSMMKIYPQLRCEPIASDYSDIESKIKIDGISRLMLFLGSNIGNYAPDEAVTILLKFASVLSKGDFFLLGVDLVKDPARILAAYNDAKGITAQFNYNLLTRLNHELEADFAVENFIHYPLYNPVLKRAESYLVSKCKQTVTIKAAQKEIYLEAWEPIHTEISRKFTLPAIENLATQAGFSLVENYFDRNNDFCCSLWQKK